MSIPEKRFPLSLAALDEKSARSSATSPRATQGRGQPETPQTATRNAAGNAARNALKGLDRSGSSSPSGLLRPPTSASVPSSAKTTRSGGEQLNVTGMAGSKPAGKNPFAQVAGSQGATMASGAIRRAMVERVAQQGVRDAKVLAALEAVPRHLFLEQAFSSQAYIDASLPIGHHQTISQPYIVARMIEVMRANRSDGKLDRVLEIGTGCGYQAAVLSLVAKEVYSIERIKPLHELAKTNLRPLRIANIRLQYGDGMLGLPQVAPFDGIILAAAGLEVPQALYEQLSIGGRLVAPVGGRHQVLQLIERTGKHDWTTVIVEDCHFVPLRSGTV